MLVYVLKHHCTCWKHYVYRLGQTLWSLLVIYIFNLESDLIKSNASQVQSGLAFFLSQYWLLAWILLEDYNLVYLWREASSWEDCDKDITLDSFNIYHLNPSCCCSSIIRSFKWNHDGIWIFFKGQRINNVKVSLCLNLTTVCLQWYHQTYRSWTNVFAQFFIFLLRWLSFLMCSEDGEKLEVKNIFKVTPGDVSDLGDIGGTERNKKEKKIQKKVLALFRKMYLSSYCIILVINWN